MALVMVGDNAFTAERQALSEIFGRITGQVFKLLPMREDGEDWVKPLNTLLVEVCGLTLFLPDEQRLYMLASKLNGLKSSLVNEDFMLFRRTIFEVCGLADSLKESFEGSEQ